MLCICTLCTTVFTVLGNSFVFYLYVYTLFLSFLNLSPPPPQQQAELFTVQSFVSSSVFSLLFLRHSPPFFSVLFCLYRCLYLPSPSAFPLPLFSPLCFASLSFTPLSVCPFSCSFSNLSSISLSFHSSNFLFSIFLCSVFLFLLFSAIVFL